MLLQPNNSLQMQKEETMTTNPESREGKLREAIKQIQFQCSAVFKGHAESYTTIEVIKGITDGLLSLPPTDEEVGNGKSEERF